MKVAKDMALYQLRYSPTAPLSVTPPWLVPAASVDLSMLQEQKESGNIAQLVEDRLNTVYQSAVPVFTDGSKDPGTGRTGFAFRIPTMDVYVKRRTSDHLSVYTVEMLAIASALQWAEESQIREVVLCSDSCSVLMSLQSSISNSRQDIIYEIFETLHRIKNMNIRVTFMWVPAHRGVVGNELVDTLAKESLKMNEVIEIALSKSEAKCLIKEKIMREWQHEWDTAITGRHPYAVQSVVGKARPANRTTKEERILTRLRVGHAGINKTLHLIGKHPSGLCEHCQEVESVEHVILWCPKYSHECEVLKREVRTAQEELTLKNVLTVGVGGFFKFLSDTELISRI